MRISWILLLIFLACCRAEADYLRDSERLAVLFGLLRQGRVVDQGPVQCYDFGGAFVDCLSALYPGQDGQYIGVPKPRSISAAMQRLNGDLISRDYGTGLVWTSCPLDDNGAPISDALCTPPPIPPYSYGFFTQTVARGHCNALNQRSYGGMTGWRLPLIRELLSLAIFDSSKYDQAAFPGALNPTWSDSTRGGASLYYSVSLFSVTRDPGGTSNLIARCVSGVPLRTGNFRVISGSSVLDMDTGLVFTRCSAGQNDPDCTGSPALMNWEDALRYCDSLSKDGRRWRLPAFHEMMVVFQIDADTPFDSEAFPNAPGNGSYWTSTTDPNSVGTAMVINLPITFDPINSANKGNPFYALCVSGP